MDMACSHYGESNSYEDLLMCARKEYVLRSAALSRTRPNGESWHGTVTFTANPLLWNDESLGNRDPFWKS